MGRTEELLELRTDSKQISRRVCKQPRDRYKIYNGLDLGLLALELVAGGADPDRKDSTNKDGKCSDKGIEGVILNKQDGKDHKKWSREDKKARRAVESENGERKNR